MAAPPAEMAAQTPSARLRSRPSAKTTVSIDSAAGAISAPPRPWTSRAAMSRPETAGEAAEERGGGEQRRPGDEDPPAAEPVGELAAEQEEAAEGQRVAGDDPRQVLGALDVQRPCDVGQGDVHDADVEHDHELAHAEDEQREALPHLAPVGVRVGPERGPDSVVVTGTPSDDSLNSR